MNSIYSQRSRLYSLQPLELDRQYIESLTSYITRISRVHCVSPVNLISSIVAPLLKKEFLNNSIERGGNRFYDGAKTLNGFDLNSIDMVNVLTQLTNVNNLSETTLQSLDGIISSRNLFKSCLSWCPLCYEEWLNLGLEIFNPLIWYLKAVRSCNIHSCKLQKQCNKCTKEIPILHRKSILGYCPYCQNWLGNKIPEQSETRDIWMAEKSVELISNKKRITNYSKDNQVTNNLNKLCLVMMDGNKEKFARLLNVPKTTMWEWCKGKGLIPLERVLEICYICGLSPLNFYVKDIESTPIFLNEPLRLLDRREEIQITTRNKRVIKHKDIWLLLKKYLEEDSIPKTMSQVAFEMDLCKRTLYKYFPDICKGISARYKKHIKLKAQQNYDENCNNISIAIATCKEKGMYPSRRKIEDIMNKPVLLKNKKLRLFYQKELERSFFFARGAGI
ncbi:TniQ family protein [Bacillus thuringiensis]|uniref:TniQ family protein n=1 Tax=Bacillus thuringiensis TaxID=1428 RepID=UPI000A36DF6D|nr:TniQ family protein [Bacillus thuringiensis]OUA85949.1 hypothetical protein BK706_22150 [Bacillus thuringiensis serovar leesis]